MRTRVIWITSYTEAVMKALSGYSFKKRHLFLGLAIAGLAAYAVVSVPFGSYDYRPGTPPVGAGGFTYGVPLDPKSPWPKFRANELQNGRSPVKAKIDPSARPWEFKTGKGIFSSPVIDGDGTVYIGSADRSFYAITKDGRMKWRVATGEIIDSAALLDDRGRVYVGSGDSHVYCIDRADGKVLWKFGAHSVQEVQKEFGLKTYNVNWFEGNVAMLRDGTIIAPNDNYLVYSIDRDTGKKKTQFVANEMIWSLPAVNTGTGRIFFGTQFAALKNVFSFDAVSGKKRWSSGGLGSNAASPMLTSGSKKGALVIGGFDGYVRAYAQDSGKELWKRGVRDHIYASAAQLSDGTVIVPSADGSVYALSPEDGKIRWAFDTLEPIRSSPAVDGLDRVYVGSGEGRLFCINPDGTLRWAYRCIEDDRNDLNASPALGPGGVCVAGENGGVFFVPYDYPLTDAGKKDPRCTPGPKEDLPDEGVFMIFTTRFGGLRLDPPKEIDANQPLTFTLFVRKKGDTVLSAIDRDSLSVKVTGNPKFKINVAANRRFAVFTPLESWAGPDGGPVSVTIKGTYATDLSRFGLKFFGGSHGGKIDRAFTFTVPPRKGGAMPYRVPAKPGDPSSRFSISRLAAPNPTMLPSWNQIGFDSLHYVAGAVEGGPDRALFWVIGGKPGDRPGETAVNPALEVRYPLELAYDRGLLTFRNYDGFKINFIGSWDMPFGYYRLAGRSDPASGEVLGRVALTAVTLCDEIEFYGKFLKLMGMSEFDTGHMAVYGGMNLRRFGEGAFPSGAGKVSFSLGKDSASAAVTGGTLKKKEHVFSLVLVDAKRGAALPLYYTKRTKVETAADGAVNKVTVSFSKGEVRGPVRAYYMVDTYPAARGDLRP